MSYVEKLARLLYWLLWLFVFYNIGTGILWLGQRWGLFPS